MVTKAGTKSHKLHSKRAIARQFKPYRKCWFIYWRIQHVLIGLGFSYERSLAKQGGHNGANKDSSLHN